MSDNFEMNPRTYKAVVIFTTCVLLAIQLFR